VAVGACDPVEGQVMPLIAALSIGSRRLAGPHRPCLSGRIAGEVSLARIEDIAEPTRHHVLALDCPSFDTSPFIAGRPLANRRVAMVTSAAIHPRGTPVFPFGSPEVRLLPATLGAGDLVMSHVSINYDRSGFQADLNTIYPIDRLRELAAEGVIGGVADTHYSVMGSTDPRGMAMTADQIVGQLRQERSDAVLLSPV
jgi:D-proline reductase (dithiol) PrdB